LHPGFSKLTGENALGSRKVLDHLQCISKHLCLAVTLVFLGGVDADSAQSVLLNGSFEQGFSGWIATGNQGLVNQASQGVQAVRFNSGQKTPNAVLSQTFSTVAGGSYTLTFDYGVFCAVSSKQQRLQLSIQSKTLLVSQLITQSSFGSAVQYFPKSFLFVADGASTTITFTDASLITDSVDSYLDNVQVK
jgi:Protein of unknown function (DUF642)